MLIFLYLLDGFCNFDQRMLLKLLIALYLSCFSVVAIPIGIPPICSLIKIYYQNEQFETSKAKSYEYKLVNVTLDLVNFFFEIVFFIKSGFSIPIINKKSYPFSDSPLILQLISIHNSSIYNYAIPIFQLHQFDLLFHICIHIL